MKLRLKKKLGKTRQFRAYCDNCNEIQNIIQKSHGFVCSKCKVEHFPDSDSCSNCNLPFNTYGDDTNYYCKYRKCCNKLRKADDNVCVKCKHLKSTEVKIENYHYNAGMAMECAGSSAYDWDEKSICPRCGHNNSVSMSGY